MFWALSVVLSAGFGASPTSLVDLQAVVNADAGLVTALETPEVFESPLAKRAKRAFDRRDYAAAYAHISKVDVSPNQLELRYFKGLCALRANEFKVAAKMFESTSQGWYALADFSNFHAATAYQELGERDKAVRHYLRVSRHSAKYLRARFLLAKLLSEQERPRMALAALGVLASDGSLGDYSRAKVLHEIAKVASKHEQRADERRALVALYTKHPRTPFGIWAMSRLKKFTLTDKEHLQYADTMVTANRDEVALAVFRRTARRKLPHRVACIEQFLKGKIKRKARRHRDAIRLLKPVVEACTADALLPRALYVLAYSQSVISPIDARQTYAQLSALFPGHEFADDALFRAAQIDVQQNQPKLAAGRLDQLVLSYPRSDFSGEAHFLRFYLQYEAGNFGAAWRALTALEKMPLTESRGEEDRERARYWQARILEKRGQVQAAIEKYRAISIAHPATYHGYLALDRLNALDLDKANKVRRYLNQPLAPLKPARGEIAQMKGDPHYQAGRTLLKMKLPGARAELLRIDVGHYSYEAALAYFHLMNSLGEGRAAALRARQALQPAIRGPRTAQNIAVWRATYPERYGDLLARYGDRRGVDPSLMMALVRQESAFNPKARSSAGALGLMQLMPTTANAVARQLRVPMQSGDLYRPSRNVSLGSQYLARLLSRFDGQSALAVASYNAGPTRVSRWRRSAPEKPVDQWVEEIPIAETRNYVKVVLGGYAAYRLLSQG